MFKNLTLKTKKIILIITALIITILILGLILVLKKNKTSLADEQLYQSEVSYPTSFQVSPVSNTTNINKKISFTLNTPAMLIKPTKWVLQMNSIFNLDHTIDVKEGRAKITGEDFELYIFTNMGERGGFYDSVGIDSRFSDTKLAKTLFKVKTAYNNLDANTIEDKFTNYYFYTEDFRTMDVCGTNEDADGCGSPIIDVQSGYYNFHFSVFCATNDSQISTYCDEFVKNLEVEVKEISN